METAILYQPIADLPVSKSFNDESRRLGFFTLKEITDAGWHQLLKMEGFSYWWLNELVTLLERHKLIHMLGKRPGI
ncbi:hypothetical protein SAMN05216436_12663 [bacterium A37T11]|nr:hypothetical protein SAMN05216436_12663 [bacterium A37T11]